MHERQREGAKTQESDRQHLFIELEVCWTMAEMIRPIRFWVATVSRNMKMQANVPWRLNDTQTANTQEIYARLETDGKMDARIGKRRSFHCLSFCARVGVSREFGIRNLVAQLKVIRSLVAYYFSYCEHNAAAKGSAIVGMRWATIGRRCNVHNMRAH